MVIYPPGSEAAKQVDAELEGRVRLPDQLRPEEGLMGCKGGGKKGGQKR